MFSLSTILTATHRVWIGYYMQMQTGLPASRTDASPDRHHDRSQSSLSVCLSFSIFSLFLRLNYSEYIISAAEPKSCPAVAVTFPPITACNTWTNHFGLTLGVTQLSQQLTKVCRRPASVRFSSATFHSLSQSFESEMKEEQE
jgi:hypothetical protein